jgi:hypothetical protein
MMIRILVADGNRVSVHGFHGHWATLELELSGWRAATHLSESDLRALRDALSKVLDDASTRDGVDDPHRR